MHPSRISKQEFNKIKTEENEAINTLVNTIGLKVKHFYDRDA
jgi:hypothetical protein